MKEVSIKTKLLFVTGIMMFLFVIGFILNSYINQSKNYEKALENEVRVYGKLLINLIASSSEPKINDILEKFTKQIVEENNSISGISITKKNNIKKSVNSGLSNKDKFIQFPLKQNNKIIGNLNIYYSKNAINKKIISILNTNIIIGSLMFLVSLLILSFTFGKIKKRLELLTNISNKIANGDLVSSKEILIKTVREQSGNKDVSELDDEILFKKIALEKQFGGKDELNNVLIEFYSMVQSLSLLIKRIKRTEDAVSDSTEEISSGARDIEASSIQQSASTHEISVTNEEVGATSKELYSNIDNIGQEIKRTVILASDGKSGLLKMEEAMNKLISSTRSISSKLAVINSKTNKISGVSTTINTISDQTNLLSINAAIEAEKAGDYGKGFLVIAKEINHLANRTTVATQEIENMVSEMQSSVLSGVMEMDKFSGEVKKRVDEVEGIGGNLTEIINQVQDLEPEFEVIREGMTAQSTSTAQISESMGQLAESTKQTKNSMIEFKTVTDVLKKTVSKLREEILRFKI